MKNVIKISLLAALIAIVGCRHSSTSNQAPPNQAPIHYSFAHGEFQSTFVIKPNAPETANQYATWASLMTAMGLSLGNKTLLLDDSLAAIHCTAGTWNVDNVIFRSERNVQAATLHLDEGCVWHANRIDLVDSFTLSSDATATVPIVSNAANGALRMVVRGGATVKSTTAIAFIQQSAGGSVAITVTQVSTLGDGTHPVLTTDGGQSSTVNGFSQARINAHTLAGAGTTQVPYDASVTLNTTQDVSTFTPLVRSLEGETGHTTVSKTGNYTLNSNATTPDYRVWANTTGGAFAITLPAPAAGLEFIIVDSGNDFNALNLTLTRHGAETINGVAANLALTTSGAAYLITTDATNWWVNKMVIGP